jgi:tRNA pseudouridine38-40 synthase
MPRYFLELSYKGAAYAGFQIQENAGSIQEEVEKALRIFYRHDFSLTGSSRTDTGVNARSNYFHFDWEAAFKQESIYNLNALLPADIALKRVVRVKPDAHARFDAISREYRYSIYRFKDAFLNDRAYYYPYAMDLQALKEAAAVIPLYTDFTSFSKRNSQVKTYTCQVFVSEWYEEGDCLVYRVKANRFLRGMVRGLVGTMLHVGRGKKTVEELKAVIEAGNNELADFAVPGHGLFLERVEYDWHKILYDPNDPE